MTTALMALRVLAIEIQSILLLLVQGTVRFQQRLSLEPGRLVGGEEKRTVAVWLMSAGCHRLIRRMTVEAASQL